MHLRDALMDMAASLTDRGETTLTLPVVALCELADVKEIRTATDDASLILKVRCS